jgi:hypothetical protein
MQVINLTSHTITDTTTGEIYEPSGMILRAQTNQTKLEGYGQLNVSRYKSNFTMDLPEQLDNTVYIVSAMALSAIPSNRTDFIAPGPVEKDENYRPIGCRGFRR